MPVITEEDIIGEGQFGYLDIAGNYVLRTFKYDQNVFELGGQAYQNLRQLVEQFLKNKTLRSAVSIRFVEEAIFNWCRDRFRGEAHERLSDRLLVLVNEAVQPLVLWYPISNLEVEGSHSIGPVRIETITSEMIDAVQGTMLDQAPPEAQESVDRYIDKTRGELQGTAAAVLSMTAERQHAFEIGLASAEEAIGFLRFFAEGALTPWRISPIAPLGSEGEPTARALVYKDGAFIFDMQHLRHECYATWRITEAQWAMLEKRGLKALGDIIATPSPTEFQQRIAKAVLTYSRSCAVPDLNDRLVYAFSALEGLFLRNSSEPIQQNLGERMAFLLTPDPAARQRVVKCVRDAYQLRSGYIHHGVTIREAHLLDELVMNAHAAISGAIRNVGRFTKTDEFIEGIERIKFGVTPHQG